MKLVEALNSKISILEQIDEAEGEITEQTETNLALIEKSIAENIDQVCYYRSLLKSQIDTDPKDVRAWATILKNRLENKLKNLDFFLKFVIEKHGKIKTAHSSVSIVEKVFESVEILDFHECCIDNKDCVTTSFSEDKSEMVVKLNKNLLAKKEVKIGFKINENVSTYILSKSLGK